jgi:UDP-3-O-[3-hydroxymyristoyl] N-acetylglucosamine deacetylase
MRQQQTIGQAITIDGTGLHTGLPVSVTVRPAPPDTGLLFLCRSAFAPIPVRATIRNLAPSELCTAIAANGGSVKTIEHLMASLVGCQIDNAYLEVSGEEIPVMDGSSGAFVRLMRAAGVVPQDRHQPYLKIVKPVEVRHGKRSVVVKPSPYPRVTYTIEYSHPLIQRQTYDFAWSPDAFEREIADARTFGFLHEVESLWARGLAKGGSLDNTVVLSDHEVLNQTGLRYRDEFVRHKVLDLIGDMALLGLPIIGHVVADCSGHAMHTRLAEQILKETDCWILLGHDERARAAQVSRRPKTLPELTPPVSPAVLPAVAGY